LNPFFRFFRSIFFYFDFHSSVPLLTLSEAARAAGSPTSTSFGLIAKVVKVFDTISITASAINYKDTPSFVLRRKRILVNSSL
jgi:hypothetical protein